MVLSPLGILLVDWFRPSDCVGLGKEKDSKGGEKSENRVCVHASRVIASSVVTEVEVRRTAKANSMKDCRFPVQVGTLSVGPDTWRQVCK